MNEIYCIIKKFLNILKVQLEALSNKKERSVDLKFIKQDVQKQEKNLFLQKINLYAQLFRNNITCVRYNGSDEVCEADVGGSKCRARICENGAFNTEEFCKQQDLSVQLIPCNTYKGLQRLILHILVLMDVVRELAPLQKLLVQFLMKLLIQRQQMMLVINFKLNVQLTGKECMIKASLNLAQHMMGNYKFLVKNWI
ncbi:unnamed protein product [Paramecium sonneborni]|uniref:Uncharacterized protein n=1 Tax=Paramecium sonneborni TaxID=65129 RepID=A0A8S1RP39_9CILI|nr:unnamed protein product [Paramecium sonneborni]